MYFRRGWRFSSTTWCRSCRSAGCSGATMPGPRCAAISVCHIRRAALPGRRALLLPPEPSTDRCQRRRLLNRRSRLRGTNARDDFLCEALHLGFERLELQHEQLDPDRMEGADARRDLVVAADEPSRRSAIAADPRGLL